MAEKESINLAKVRRRVYIRTKEVNNLTHYFSVSKGADRRMVYNRTSSGLNSSLWVPHFGLPTVGSNLCEVERATFILERDTGEMFLNLILSEEVRYFYGVDVTNVRTEEGWDRDRSGGWERWESKMMGLADLHYHAYQAVTWDKRIAMGYLLELKNPFAWEKVVLKLPQNKEYYCQRPWVFKKSIDDLLAADLVIYVGDRRRIGPTKKLC